MTQIFHFTKTHDHTWSQVLKREIVTDYLSTRRVTGQSVFRADAQVTRDETRGELFQNKTGSAKTCVILSQEVDPSFILLSSCPHHVLITVTMQKLKRIYSCRSNSGVMLQLTVISRCRLLVKDDMNDNRDIESQSQRRRPVRSFVQTRCLRPPR